MTIHHTRLAAAIDQLDWLTTSPHRLPQLIGIYAEVLAGQSQRFRHGATPAEMADQIRARTEQVGGRAKGGHADPTADTALAGTPDADDGDETIGQMRHAETLLVRMTDELDTVIASAAGVAPVDPAHTLDGAHTWATHAHAHLTTALDHDPDALGWIAGTILEITDTTSWLHGKAEWIWTAAHGTDLPVAEQRAITECTICSRWRTGTVATSRGRCTQCATFQDHHKCLPTEPIVRRWEATGSGATPPGMILEARAR